MKKIEMFAMFIPLLILLGLVSGLFWLVHGIGPAIGVGFFGLLSCVAFMNAGPDYPGPLGGND